MSTERARYIDRVLDETYEAVQLTDTARYLGQAAVDHVLDLLDTTVVANARHGIVSLPQSADPNAIPIVAMYPDETLRRGEEFSSPSDDQRRSFLRVLTEWDPQNTPPEAAISLIMSIPQPIYPVPAPGNRMSAMTSTQDVVTRTDALTAEFGLRQHLVKPVVKFMFRPLIVVKIRQAEPDVVCHELIHVDQKTREPIRLFGSQHDINMDALGDETPAYHIGAGVRLGIETGKPSHLQVDPSLQMAAERVRRDLNDGKRDPFAPSELLLSSYVEHGMHHILHGALNYELIRQNLHLS